MAKSNEPIRPVIVKKVYEVTEGAKSDEHLINLKLTLTNTGATAHKSEEYYLYSGAANSMRPDEALKPSFFWNDAGDATQKLTDSFSGGWFSTEQAEMRSTHTRLRFSGVMSRFDAIILDLMLPEVDGLEVCKILRRDPSTATIPILMLTARAAEMDRRHVELGDHVEEVLPGEVRRGAAARRGKRELAGLGQREQFGEGLHGQAGVHRDDVGRHYRVR